jgi:NAD(P)-dependent dehydrogenase (short-subunit alcohol dehydrogenase family)
MTDRLAGKVGIVTGASSGIGRATALAVAAEGATVVAAARSLGGLAETERLGVGTAGSLRPQQCDVRSEADVKALFAVAESVTGGIDFVVNCAGVSRSASLTDFDIDIWEEIQAVNVRGTLLCCKYAVESMLRTSSRGSIVNVGSTLSLVGSGRAVPYTASKHAVLGVTRAAASDLTIARAGIRVNCVCPGDVETPLIARHFDHTEDPTAARKRAGDLYPAGRLGEPSEVASVIVFLASDDSSLIHGAAITADMGLTARGY